MLGPKESSSLGMGRVKLEQGQAKACPACKTGVLRRSQMRGLVERGLLRPIGLRAYRCDECDGRFYRFGTDHERAHEMHHGKA